MLNGYVKVRWVICRRIIGIKTEKFDKNFKLICVI